MFGSTVKEMVAKTVPMFMLVLLMHGMIPSMLNQDNYPVDATELKHMSGAVMKENGNMPGKTEEEIVNDCKRVLYTASVIENRKNSDAWKGSTTEEVIMAKEGPYYQYASVTRNNFKTVEYTEYVEACCHYVLYFGSVIPENIVYQGQGKNGSGVYDRIPVRGDKDELFCYE